MDRYTKFKAVSNLLTRSTHGVDLRTIDWPFLIRLSGTQLISPTLYVRLSTHPDFEIIPRDAQDFLEATYTLNKHRNEAIRAQTMALLRLLNTAGIQPMLLKGAANILGNLYIDPAERITADIDFYVKKREAADTIGLLKKHGYFEQMIPRYDKKRFAEQHHHFPSLEHPEYITRIELHRELSPQRVPPVVTAAEMYASAQTYYIEDTKFLIPSSEMRVLHNIVNIQLQDWGFTYKFINLRQLYDFILLNRKSPDNIHWQKIQRHFFSFNLEEVPKTYLLLAEELLGFQTPSNIIFSPYTKRWLASAKRRINLPRLFRYQLYASKLKSKYYKLFDLKWYLFKLKHRRFKKAMYNETKKDLR